MLQLLRVLSCPSSKHVEQINIAWALSRIATVSDVVWARQRYEHGINSCLVKFLTPTHTCLTCSYKFFQGFGPLASQDMSSEPSATICSCRTENPVFNSYSMTVLRIC